MNGSEATRGWNGYLDWAATLAAAAGAPDAPWEPVFVRSTRATVGTDAFFDAAEAAPGIRFDPFERNFNRDLREAGAPVEAILYRHHDRAPVHAGFEGAYEVLAAGVPVTGKGLPAGPPVPAPAPAPDSAARAPVVLGIIDDGLAVFHPRFRSGPASTRVLALWAQTLARVEGATGMALGRVFDKAALDAALARLGPLSEDDLYRAQAAALYPPSTRHSLRRRASHGTLMLDLAAGAAPGAGADPMQAVPILAVQVPPQSFDDTSGLRLQTHILQGLRWLIHRTLAGGIAERLVVNMSLGIVAGAKDGTSFLEQQIAREIARAEAAGLRVDLALPYGNAYEDRLIARQTLAPGAEMALTLRVPADDRTPGFVELRPVGGSAGSDPGVLAVTLGAPDGTTLAGRVPAGRHLTLTGPGGRPVARLYHTPARTIWNGATEPAYLTLALAPTAVGFGGAPVAQPGGWRIALRNAGADPIDLVAQVQRDDSPFPRRTGARQAYLDDARAHGWHAERRDYSALQGDGALTHAGTNSAYSTVAHPDVHSIGAARAKNGAVVPAAFTAEGADWSGRMPAAGAVTEHSRALPGALGAGTLAAATAALSGTSAAAAGMSRHLMLKALGGAGLDTGPTAGHESRLGGEVLLANPADRRGR